MLFAVFHAKKPNFGLFEHVEFSDETFDLVALVEAEHGGHVYERTNNIEGSWFNNEGVSVIKESRSTSIGDVVQQVSDGKLFRCDMAGWTEMESSKTSDQLATKLFELVQESLYEQV